MNPASCFIDNNSLASSCNSNLKSGLQMSVINPWYQLGYVIPHLYADLDAYQFYRVAPEGMMLVTTGFNLKEYSLAAVEEELPVLQQQFDLLADKKVNRIS